MKALSRPMSSPNRTDKFATPLIMRFLRSNVSSKSRGRSRSSPMFIVRSKKNSTAAPPLNEIQQEPTSPKVTCIGQVRARRSSSKKTSSSSSAAAIVSGKSKRSVPEPPPQNSCCCYCYCCEKSDSKRFDFSQHFRSSFNKPRTNCTIFRKWGRFFRFGYCKKVDIRDDSSKFESIQRHRKQFGSTNSSGIDIDEREIEGFSKMSKMIQESKEVAVESSTPPKNAFLLTRCRSAPYRSSSLAVRFWGSPLGFSETEKSNTEVQEEIPAGKEIVIPTDLECDEVGLSSRSSNEVNGELDENGKGRPKEDKIQDFGGGSIHPLLLTRCKSEPAKTGERLNPDTNFWRQRRSDTAESCLQLSDLIS